MSLQNQINLQMNNEESSPSLIPTQKSITENKQTTSIRKVTIESISPVIQKVEQHIAYLIAQTTNLRNQNASLIATQTNQKVLEQQINKINTIIQQLESKVHAQKRQKDKKLALQGIQLQRIEDQIRAVKTDNLLQANRVEQINKNNQTYLNLIETSKQQQNEAVQQLKLSIQRYYKQELIKIGSVAEQMDEIRHKILFLQEKRFNDQEQVKKITNIINLYQFEREETKKLIHRTTFLENNIMMAEQYEKDKKMTNIHMELVKSDIKNMLDETLTPQIRKFLPVLIKKLGELNSFQSKLQRINVQLHDSRSQLQKNTNQVKQQLNNKLTELNNIISTSFDQLQKKIDQEIAKVEDKSNDSHSFLKQKFNYLQEQIGFNKKLAQINLQQTNSKLQNDMKKYIVVWGDKFIHQKKTQIYKMMQELRPKEQVQQQKKVFQMVYQIQPLLNKVKQQIDTFTKESKKQKDQFYQKLGIFNNHMTKMKSDMIIESTEHKKAIQLINGRLKNHDHIQNQISKLISKLTQINVITYALSLDSNFLDKDQQVYVTYNDGLLVQIEGSTLKYRRKDYQSQILKRAVLKQMVKMIDNIIINEPFLKWNKEQMKPSHFNTLVNSSYNSLQQQNGERIKRYQSIYMQERRGLSGQNSYQINKQRVTPRNKFLSFKDSMSKTIQLESKQSKQFASTARYERQQNPVLIMNQNNNLKNIRLKKIDKKE